MAGDPLVLEDAMFMDADDDGSSILLNSASIRRRNSKNKKKNKKKKKKTKKTKKKKRKRKRKTKKNKSNKKKKTKKRKTKKKKKKKTMKKTKKRRKTKKKKKKTRSCKSSRSRRSRSRRRRAYYYDYDYDDMYHVRPTIYFHHPLQTRKKTAVQTRTSKNSARAAVARVNRHIAQHKLRIDASRRPGESDTDLAMRLSRQHAARDRECKQHRGKQECVLMGCQYINGSCRHV